jgi:hypothetical protein
VPTNRPSTTALSARLTTLALDVQRAADQLLAEPMNDVEVSRHLSAPVVLLSALLDQLADAIYRAEKLEQSNRLRDLEIARLIVGSNEATPRQPPELPEELAA